MNSHLKIFAVAAATALLVPAAAAAKRPEDKSAKGDKTAETKLVTANVKGTVATNDGSTMTVTVNKASGHAKGCKGATLTFDASAARIHTADNDADGDLDVADVLVGHDVKVRTQVALSKGRKTTCSVAATDALMARAVHNRTTPEVEDDAETVEDQSGEVEGESLEAEEQLEDEEKVKDKEAKEKKSKDKKSKD